MTEEVNRYLLSFRTFQTLLHFFQGNTRMINLFGNNLVREVKTFTKNNYVFEEL